MCYCFETSICTLIQFPLVKTSLASGILTTRTLLWNRGFWRENVPVVITTSAQMLCFYDALVTPGQAISAVHALHAAKLRFSQRLQCSSFSGFHCMQPDHLWDCMGNTGSHIQPAEIVAHLTCITLLSAFP